MLTRNCATIKFKPTSDRISSQTLSVAFLTWCFFVPSELPAQFWILVFKSWQNQTCMANELLAETRQCLPGRQSNSQDIRVYQTLVVYLFFLVSGLSALVLFQDSRRVCLFQPIENFNEWRLLYFISFLLLVGFFVLNMFVGVVVENFHKCRESQEKEEKARRAAKRAKKMERKRRSMANPNYRPGLYLCTGSD